MSEVTPSPERQRILVAIDTSPLALKAVEMAVRMAAELQRELEGMFYEDAQLLKLSGLPFVRETGYTSAAGRPLSPTSMQRSLRAKADDVRRCLAQLCSEQKLPWSLTTVRERASRHALESAANVDLMVIGIESRQPQGSVQWRPSDRSEHSVVVLYDSSAAGRRALTTGKRAAEQGRRLIVLPVAESDEAARRLGRQALQDAPSTAELHPGRVDSVNAILHAVRSRHGELLIAPWGLSIADDTALERLVDELDCLLMLVR